MAPGAIIIENSSFLPLNHHLETNLKEAVSQVTEVMADSPIEGQRVYIPPTPKLPASTRLQKMIHETDDLIVCPGVYDGLSARTAHEVGFDALYMVSPSAIKFIVGTSSNQPNRPVLAHLPRVLEWLISDSPLLLTCVLTPK